MKLNLKQSNNPYYPVAEAKKVAAPGVSGNSRIANLKKLKQRQFGDYCFDYIAQCKHNLSNPAFHACSLCKLTHQVTRAFFEKEKKQRDKARVESNLARAKLRRQLIYMWSLCQPSFYPTQIHHDPFMEIMWSDHLVEVLNENQELFNDWFKSYNTSILKGQASSMNSKLSMKQSIGIDFELMLRIIQRRIRINDVGHIAATYLQARIRRFLTQIRIRHMLLKRFEYIPETKFRGEIFYDSLKQRKWQRFPLLIANDRPATPRTIRRRINYENQRKTEKLEKYRSLCSNYDESDATDSIESWWYREERLVHIYEHLVIIRDLISVYFHTMQSAGNVGPIWVIPSAPGLHSRLLGISIALQTLPSPALSSQSGATTNTNDQGNSSNNKVRKVSVSVSNKQKNVSLASKSEVPPTKRLQESLLSQQQVPTNVHSASNISTPMILRALMLLEQAGRDALCIRTPEEAVSLLLRSPELRGTYESVFHIVYDGVEDIWDGALNFQPYIHPSSDVQDNTHDKASAQTHDDMIGTKHTNLSQLQAPVVTGKTSTQPEDKQPVLLLPYGIQLRPLNAAFQNIPADGSTNQPISYTKPSAAQFFRLFYMDEDLLGICPSSTWVFYPEVHRYRDSIFNGIRKFANASTTRQMIHHQHQQHSQYRQKLFHRRHQLVQLRRRLRRLLYLQRAQKMFAEDEKQIEEIVLSSPAALAAAVAATTQQHQVTHSRFHNASSNNLKQNTSSSSASSLKTTASTKDHKPPLKSQIAGGKLQHQSHHAVVTDASAASVFSPTPEMIFPPYIDTNKDSYRSSYTVAQSIFALDRTRVIYLQEQYGKMAFLRKYPVFQEKLRRTQISNNRAANTASKATTATTTTSTTIDNNNDSLKNDEATIMQQRFGIILRHAWQDKNQSGLSQTHTADATVVVEDLERDDDSLSTLPSQFSSSTNKQKGIAQDANQKPADKKLNDKADGASSFFRQHPMKPAFASVLAAAASSTTTSENLSSDQHKQRHHHDHHGSQKDKVSPLLIGSDVFRLLSSMPGNNGAGANATPVAAAGAKSTNNNNNNNNNNNDAKTPTSQELTEQYLKRLYEYSVNVHTCIRDRLEDVSAFVRLPEEDIGEAGITMPVLPQQPTEVAALPPQPQPDVDAYLLKLEAEIGRLEMAAVAALDGFEMKAIEQNQGIMPPDARQRKEEREARLSAAYAKQKAAASSGTTSVQSNLLNDIEFDLVDEEEEDEYEEMFPVPTLLVLEVYVHLPTRPTQPTGAGALQNGRRNGVSVVLPPNFMAGIVGADAAPGVSAGDADVDATDGTGSVVDDGGSIVSGNESSLASSRDSFSVNSATIAARKRNSMYGFADPSAGFTPNVTLHQILGMYNCDDSVKTPEQLDCGFFSFEHFRAIYREKQHLIRQQSSMSRRISSRGGDEIGSAGGSRRQSSATATFNRQPSSKQAGSKDSSGSGIRNLLSMGTNSLTPPGHLTIENVTWGREANVSSGVLLGQVLSQPTHKMECQFMYLAQAPSRDYLDKNLPRKVKLWLGTAAPDKQLSS